MILRKDQINRYMRHIAIPEISGQGQKKIIDSSVVLFSKNPDEAALALYYLAASGVGKIYCSFADSAGWEELSARLLDFNGDVEIQLQDSEALIASEEPVTARIIAGNPDFVEAIAQNIIKSGNPEKYIPTIAAIHNGWKGAVRTFTDRIGLEGFTAEMAKCNDNRNFSGTFGCPDILSGSFSNLIAVIEHLKLALTLGKPISEALYHDLSVMEFDFAGSSADLLCKLLAPIPEACDFNALTDSKVLIVGCGGLGSPAAFALASAGVGTIGLVDYDTVEISNLNRQIMHSVSRIGMPKVQSAELFLKQINPNVRLETYNTRISMGNAKDLIGSYDMIIGALDNLPARYILNDACYAAKKPLLEAGAMSISGLATTIIPDIGHCYRCIFPESNNSNPLPSCSETGVLGPVPGVMGIIQAAEAVKLISNTGESLKNKILLFDVFDTDIYVAAVGKNNNCILCGK